MAVRTRRDAGLLPEWDDTFLWYARAIADMQTRPLDDPTSWRYQGAIHGFGRAQLQPGDPVPSDNKHFWNECQHNSWFFLPWHRWYLYYFEQIVAATVVKLGGPEDWALPYWNYSKADEDSRKIPAAFIAETTPDGTPNPLLVERDAGNDGSRVGTPDDTNVDCLDETEYTGAPFPLGAGFGGDKTKFSHSGDRNGALESAPHNLMHGAVGGAMGSFNTAGLDPLFWLHHANIDRLWAVWRAIDPAHLDPTDPDWLEMSFEFKDANGRTVSRTNADVVDTNALGYEYEDLSDPRASMLEAVAAPAPSRRPPVDRNRIAELVGATEQPVELGRAASATVQTTEPTGPAAAGLEEGVAEIGGRYIVTVENVTGSGPAQNYSVYVNDNFAGRLPTFGVAEATESIEHAGSGLSFTFDVTDIVRQLQAKGQWDPATVRVDVIADDQGAEGLEGVEAAQPARFNIGRIGVYRA